MAGEAMAGEAMAGEAMAGEAMAGEAMAGEAMAGEAMAGEAMAGEAMAGEAMAGETMTGEFGYNLCGLGATERRALGTNIEPITATYSPFVDRNDTTMSTQDLYNTYDCAADRREFGREVVYQFTMPSAGYFRAEVLESNGVDIDLHLLYNPSVDENGFVTGCVIRNDRLIELESLPAGTYQIVADSWTNASGVEFEGGFDIAFEWLPYGVWTEAPLRQGMMLKRYLGEFQEAQRLVHVVVADAGHNVVTERHDGCESVPSALSRQGDMVGINANYFNVSQRCAPTDFLKVDGTTITRNGTTMFEQRTFGWTQNGNLQVRWLPYLADWNEVFQGVGGYPSLVINSEVAVQVQEGEQVYSMTDWSDQPRSALGTTSSGQLVFAVADGRNILSNGIFNTDWAQFLSEEFNLTEGIGLDGGGSSTLVVQDCWINDVVNFPSDSIDFSHEGARAVGSGLYLR
jgi:pentapeptide MXKDX repeat protein